MDKERLVGQVEKILKTDRERLVRRELQVYEASVPFQTAVILRDALLKRREEIEERVPGAFSYIPDSEAPSNAEEKLRSVIDRFQDEVIDQHDGIVVPLSGIEIDEINTRLFPALRPRALVDSQSLAALDSLVIVNEAYKEAGGTERQSYTAGMKPYNV